MAKKPIKKTAKMTEKRSKRTQTVTPVVDGFGPKDAKRVRTACRRAWSWSYARRLVIERTTGKDGFSYCEQCKKKCPKIFVDHIDRVGEVDSGFLERLFVPSTKMQGLCKKCHNEKTKEEKAIARLLGVTYIK